MLSSWNWSSDYNIFHKWNRLDWLCSAKPELVLKGDGSSNLNKLAINIQIIASKIWSKFIFSGTTADPKVICYYINWSQYRSSGGRIAPEDVDPALCTHIIYAFAKLSGGVLGPTEWNDISTTWSTGQNICSLCQKARNKNNESSHFKMMLHLNVWLIWSIIR